MIEHLKMRYAFNEGSWKEQKISNSPKNAVFLEILRLENGFSGFL